MAALWKLPVLFVCENNQYGMGTRIDQATANTALHERAAAFGLAGSVDGIDVEVVADAARTPGRAAPAPARPGLPRRLLLPLLRPRPERQVALPRRGRGGRRPPARPVAHARARLAETASRPTPSSTRSTREIAAEMDATIDFTIAASEPPLASMFRDVYAPGEPEPSPSAPASTASWRGTDP